MNIFKDINYLYLLNDEITVSKYILHLYSSSQFITINTPKS